MFHLLDSSLVNFKFDYNFALSQKENEGLKLKLRMSNSVCLGGGGLGSVGSSPSDAAPDDCGILNVEEFLNLPSNDFVTLEESKQVCYNS